MTRFATAFRRFIADDCGATAIEYGLIGAMVSVAAITALGAMGDSLAAVFDTASSSIDGVLPAAE
ncbi:MAG: Flp family type IVb pilin [Alphaproteobacteria bacterium]